MAPVTSRATNGESLLDVPSLFRQHGLGGNIWTPAPEPLALMGPSLLLTFLVMRHQGSRGCPSPESGTHRECFRIPPACLEKTGMRAQKSFSDVVSAETPVSRTRCSTGNSAPP